MSDASTVRHISCLREHGKERACRSMILMSLSCAAAPSKTPTLTPNSPLAASTTAATACLETLLRLSSGFELAVENGLKDRLAYWEEIQCNHCRLSLNYPKAIASRCQPSQQLENWCRLGDNYRLTWS